MFDKELEMQLEARHFQMQMMHMMTSLVNGRSMPSSFLPPITNLYNTHWDHTTCLMMMMPQKYEQV